jgi:Rps23 Pro-64 3,4-dihydroxylase Tpa1-like proline 4-hydroxylase
MGTRKIAFLYYLTPNNWDYEKDGGGLVVQRKDSEELFTIQPAFNRLVMWTMVNHAVEKVRRGKGRVALVGFYRRRGDYP